MPPRPEYRGPAQPGRCVALGARWHVFPNHHHFAFERVCFSAMCFFRCSMLSASCSLVSCISAFAFVVQFSGKLLLACQVPDGLYSPYTASTSIGPSYRRNQGIAESGGIPILHVPCLRQPLPKRGSGCPHLWIAEAIAVPSQSRRCATIGLEVPRDRPERHRRSALPRAGQKKPHPTPLGITVVVFGAKRSL